MNRYKWRDLYAGAQKLALCLNGDKTFDAFIGMGSSVTVSHQLQKLLIQFHILWHSFFCSLFFFHMVAISNAVPYTDLYTVFILKSTSTSLSIVYQVWCAFACATYAINCTFKCLAACTRHRREVMWNK